MSKIQVRCKSEDGKVVFQPVLIQIAGSDLQIQPLARDEFQDGVWFETYEDAARIVVRYNDGVGDDVRAAHWDDVAGEWVATEWVSRSGRGSREDFHADG